VCRRVFLLYCWPQWSPAFWRRPEVPRRRRGRQRSAVMAPTVSLSTIRAPAPTTAASQSGSPAAEPPALGRAGRVAPAPRRRPTPLRTSGTRCCLRGGGGRAAADSARTLTAAAPQAPTTAGSRKPSSAQRASTPAASATCPNPRSSRSSRSTASSPATTGTASRSTTSSRSSWAAPTASPTSTPEEASFASGAPGYHAKDRVENAAHAWLCQGKISLRAVQRAIATNWQSLYKRILHTTPTG
jgi:hypothetical protein